MFDSNQNAYTVILTCQLIQFSETPTTDENSVPSISASEMRQWTGGMTLVLCYAPHEMMG